MPHARRLILVVCGFLAFSAPFAASAAHAAGTATSCAAQEEEENAGGATPAQLSDKYVYRGEEIGVSGDCFTPGETVDVDFHTVAVQLGTTEADGNGSASTTVTIPNEAQCGSHTITMTGEASGHVAVAGLTVGCARAGGTGGGPPPVAVPAHGPTRTPTVEPTSTQQEPPAALPFTGAQSGPLSATGAAFVVVGGLLVAGGRRRYLARHATGR